MPVARAGGARLHFAVHGRSHASTTPVMLIHGATSDGLTDWGAVAPALGLGRLVIVPDLRGHGRSDDPGGLFSFRQAARDISLLVRALGYERVHLVGHSNGGTIALVTLLEHPDSVQSCVVQAGNAYVSADLLAGEPAIFDADRVDREDPAWRDEMVRMHDRWHGAGYWRTMLAMTLRETIGGPAYSQAELALVSRPTLVIEGAEDRANGPSRHGEFIADSIPDAELWQPAGVGHSVHLERPGSWLDRVGDFWDRRGTDVRDRVWRLSQGGLGDTRHVVVDLRVDTVEGSETVRGIVSGDVDLERLEREAAPARMDVTVVDDNSRRAVVGVGVADLLSGPDAGAQRVSQALFGELVDVLEDRERFRRVRLERDGYLGWVEAKFLADPPDDVGVQHSVTAEWAFLRDTPAGSVIGRVPLGSRLVGPLEGSWLRLRRHSGPDAWVDAADIRPASARDTLTVALRRVESLVGVPYLWGGRTPFGIDCSGLAQLFGDLLGVAIPRDADEQWRAGSPAAGRRRPGDLLFFGGDTAGPAGRPVSHVGIALGGTSFVHAWGAVNMVTTSDLTPGSPMFAPSLASSFVGSRRFVPSLASSFVGSRRFVP